jgi:hypothetical protein
VLSSLGDSGLGGASSDELAVAHEDADDVVQVHAFAENVPAETRSV